MSRRILPIWRSILFVPVLNDKFVAGAARRGADAIQLDLEDSIPVDLKAAARERLRAAVGEIRAVASTDIIVRINRPWRMAVADLEAAVDRNVCAIALPKVPHAGHVQAIGEILDELEAERGLEPGHTVLIAMIETAEGLVNLASIPAASSRVVGITVGAEDLAVSTEMEPSADAMYVPNMLAVAAARAAGCLPLGFVGSIADLGNGEEFEAAVMRASRLGFAGASCVHPSQVPILNRAFSPSAEAVNQAETILQVYEEATVRGAGAVRHEGRMIDAPVAERARALLRRHSALAARRVNSL
jgi:citrate lyase subunit beta/citryl-CoA lyase